MCDQSASVADDFSLELGNISEYIIQVCSRLVDAAFADTIRLYRSNAGASKLLWHIQATTLKTKCHMTWQEIKGKGADEIRSLSAQDFNDLVPVMVQLVIGEKGLRKHSIT